MFELQFGDYILKVKFFHFWKNQNNSKKRRFWTKVQFNIFNDGDLMYSKIAFSKCNPVDYVCNKINKNLGKKLALSKLLYNTFVIGESFILLDDKELFYKRLERKFNFTKEVREEMWSKFFTEFPLYR